MIRVAAALAVAGAGQVATLLGQVAPPVSGSELGPWVSAGGATIMAGALAYVVRQLASGNMVAWQVEELAEQAEKREDRLTDIAERALAREAALERIMLNRLQGPGHG